VPRLDSGYASKATNLASAACGYLQGITVSAYKKVLESVTSFKIKSNNSLNLQFFFRKDYMKLK
jgi:hypothetical protein